MKRLILLMMLCLFSIATYAQNIILNGKITGTDDESLIGATVLEQGTNNGAVTNLNGEFHLSVSALPVTLVVSYQGYSTVTQTVESADPLNIVLDVDELELDAVVITGVLNPQSKLESSVSVTTLRPKTIDAAAPRTTAEIFRIIPGIRSESSGGEGNTNITVRGVPISSGGSKYLQLQEDGLPVLMYGDIAFATADIFLRADNTIGRIEAIRGGSASTLSSNSPAGIINFVSKNGYIAGGSVGTTFGLDYNSLRTDFEYGAPINDNLNFHIGGFFRNGEGPRTAGYTANRGGQIKANITKSFNTGYVRVYYKHLDDRTAAYMPMPVQVTGTNSDPTWESIDGFDFTQGTTHSAFLQQNFGIGADGERRNSDVRDGMHPILNSVGLEFAFDLPEGWSIENRGRMSSIRGRFISPFPAAVGTTTDMLATIGGAIGQDLTGATLSDAQTGDAYNGNLAMAVHMFDTELNNFDNMMNNFTIKKSFDIGSGSLSFKLGYFNSYQNINMSWLWNSYLMEVDGENARLLDITTAGGTSVSDNGLYAYGVPVWGNCCQQDFDLSYATSAPYVGVALDLNDNLNIDASVRYDKVDVSGLGHGGTQSTIDVNNDGVISAPEQSVSVIDNANIGIVDYNYDYFSYSIGANYKISDNMAVFARESQGASGKADRIIGPGNNFLNGSQLGVKDVIAQTELGYKLKLKKGGLFITGFYAKTIEEGGFEATTQKVIENDYTAKGVELEGSFTFNDLSIRGALTYTDAEISSGANDGNTPRRQPAVMFSLMPGYTVGKAQIGLTILGQSQAYAQDDNELVMPGYAIFNGFVGYDVTQGLSLGVNFNNLFGTIGVTESEEGSITEGSVNYVRARSITGRSLAAFVRYRF
jgi:outer membrane receptor protein involved in Fe transport